MRCCSCKTDKDESCFYKNKRSLSGFNPMCKSCYKQYHLDTYVSVKSEKELKPIEYYVYQAVKDGEIVYIGKGTGNRIDHLTSGVSHVYEANECHFSKIPIEVKIIEIFDSSEEALSRETCLISELTPAWNRFVRSLSGRMWYKGVKYEPSHKKPWRCRFVYKGKQISNGAYRTELEAALAYDQYILDNDIDKPLNFEGGKDG